MLDAQVVVEQARHSTLEAVELREAVLAQRQDEVHAQRRVVDDIDELAREGAGPVVGRVIEEVLLELVEDDEQRRHRAEPRRERLAQRHAGRPRRHVLAGRLAHGLGDGARQPQQRRVAPRAEHRRGEAHGRARRRVRGLAQRAIARDNRAQAGQDGRLQDRALADAARAVQQREPRRAQVRADDLPLAVAAEEPRDVLFAECQQADVRVLPRRAVRGCGPAGHSPRTSAASSRSSPRT